MIDGYSENHREISLYPGKPCQDFNTTAGTTCPVVTCCWEGKGTLPQGQQHGQPSTQLCPVQRSTNTAAVKAERYCLGGQTGCRAGHSEDSMIHSSALSGGQMGRRAGHSEDTSIHSSCDAMNTQEQERKPASYRHFTKKGRAGPCT